CSPPRARRRRTSLRVRHALSSFSSARGFGLAADQRAGLTLQLVGQRPQAARRPRELLQRISQLLLRGGVRSKERRISAVHCALDGTERAMQVLEARLELRDELYVGVAHELARASQRLVERLQILLEIVADRFKRHPVDLVDDAVELGLELG